MGLKELLFGRGAKGDDAGVPMTKEGKVIARHTKKLMNKYVQTQERKRIIQMLAEIGSDEAITAMLGRFTYVTDGSIVDEDEKELVYEVIRSMGDHAVPALTTFIKTQIAIYWPLKALTELKGEDAAVRALLEALETITDRFGQSMERMQNLVSCFRDYHTEEALGKLMELAADEEEEIRFLAVDGLSTFDDFQKAVDTIIERLVDDRETTRVKTYIMDLLIERKWNVKRYKKGLAEKLPDTYFVNDTGVVQRRHA